MSCITSKAEFIEKAKQKGYSEDEIKEGLKLFEGMKKDGLNVSLESVFVLPPQSVIKPDPPLEFK